MLRIILSYIYCIYNIYIYIHLFNPVLFICSCISLKEKSRKLKRIFKHCQHKQRDFEMELFKKKLLDVSMICRNQKKRPPCCFLGNGLLQQKKRTTKQLHPNRSRMNWPRLKLLLRHESGTKKRQAQRFLPRKLDSSVFPQILIVLEKPKNPHEIH